MTIHTYTFPYITTAISPSQFHTSCANKPKIWFARIGVYDCISAAVKLEPPGMLSKASKMSDSIKFINTRSMRSVPAPAGGLEPTKSGLSKKGIGA